MPYSSDVSVALIVDLDQPATERLPSAQTCDLQGISCPVIFGKGMQGLSAIALAVLRFCLHEKA